MILFRQTDTTSTMECPAVCTTRPNLTPIRFRSAPSEADFPHNENSVPTKTKQFLSAERKILYFLSHSSSNESKSLSLPEKTNSSKSDETQATDSDYKQAEGMGFKSLDSLLMPLSDNIHPHKRFLQSPHNSSLHGIIRLCRGHHKGIKP